MRTVAGRGALKRYMCIKTMVQGAMGSPVSLACMHIRPRGDMTNTEIKQTIKPFLLENFLFTKDSSALADGASLIGGGIVDSTGILELIEFIEQSYGLHIAAEEMVPANFDSLDAISVFVRGKLLQ